SGNFGSSRRSPRPPGAQGGAGIVTLGWELLWELFPKIEPTEASTTSGSIRIRRRSRERRGLASRRHGFAPTGANPRRDGESPVREGDRRCIAAALIARSEAECEEGDSNPHRCCPLDP